MIRIKNTILAIVGFWSSACLSAPIYDVEFSPYPVDTPTSSYGTSAYLTENELFFSVRYASSGSFFSAAEEHNIKFTGALIGNTFSAETYRYEHYFGRFLSDQLSSIDLSQPINDILPRALLSTVSYSSGTGPEYNFDLKAGGYTRLALPFYPSLSGLYFNGLEVDVRTDAREVGEPPTYSLIAVAILFLALRQKRALIYNKANHVAALDSQPAVAPPC